MKNKEKAMEIYEAPIVEVIEVEVEKGFSSSLEGSFATGEGMSGGGSTGWPNN